MIRLQTSTDCGTSVATNGIATGNNVRYNLRHRGKTRQNCQDGQIQRSRHEKLHNIQLAHRLEHKSLSNTGNLSRNEITNYY